MSKILAVFGATGKQGNSVLTYVLNDAELSQQYKIRAITRDPQSASAKQLPAEVEVVRGDVTDRASLETALTGAHTVFAMTTPVFTPDGDEVEYNHAKMMADVAVEKGVHYYIFSTLPPTKKITGGRVTKVFPFDAKAKAEEYIRTLPIKSAFYMPGSFMENFQEQIWLAPVPMPDGTWALLRHTPPTAKLPLIAAVADSGKFVGAILAEPDKYEGKVFCAAERLYSWDEVADAMSKSTGKSIVVKEVSGEEFAESLIGLTGMLNEMFVEAFAGYGEYGYFGPDEKDRIAWAVENAREKPITLDDFFQKHPFRLERTS